MGATTQLVCLALCSLVCLVVSCIRFPSLPSVLVGKGLIATLPSRLSLSLSPVALAAFRKVDWLGLGLGLGFGFGLGLGFKGKGKGKGNHQT